jgi:hypothetical protein
MCFQQHDFFHDLGRSFKPIERGIAATGKPGLTCLAGRTPDLFSLSRRPIRYQRVNRLVGDATVVTIWLQTGMPLGGCFASDDLLCPFSLRSKGSGCVGKAEFLSRLPVLFGKVGNLFDSLVSSAGL